MARFLGNENVSTIPLSKLEQDRFASAQLFGKLANICADISDVNLETSGVIKAITGGDAISAEFKHRDPFKFVPTAKLIFASNHLPRSKDTSKALSDRMIIVPFTKVFPRNPAKKRSLEATLSSPQEWSGVLNRALKVLPRVRERGLTISPSVDIATDEFRETADLLAAFLDSETEIDPAGILPVRSLIEAFNIDLKDKGAPPSSDQSIGRFKELRPEIHTIQRTVGDTPGVRVYAGIRFKDEEAWQRFFEAHGIPFP